MDLRTKVNNINMGFWLLLLSGILTSTCGSFTSGKLFEKASLNVSLIQAERLVLVEASWDLLSCVYTCNQAENCYGVAFTNIGRGICLVIKDHRPSESISLALNNFLFYQKQLSTPSVDCEDYLLNTPGTHSIQLGGVKELVAFCDYKPNGNWLVLQRRLNGSVDFYRNWEDYKAGFGDPSGEFWFGNENLHLLTRDRNYVLRIELTNQDGVVAVAQYGNFSVGDESSNYALTVGAYDGSYPPGDSMYPHHQKGFSTYDRDNSEPGNCARQRLGGWWYKNCFMANLNGRYGDAYFRWNTWDKDQPLKAVEVMVKRI